MTQDKAEKKEPIYPLELEMLKILEAEIVYLELSKAAGFQPSVSRSLMSFIDFCYTQYPRGPSIDILDLRPKTLNALREAGIHYIEQLNIMHDSILLRIPEIGRSSVKEIRECLAIQASDSTTEKAPDV